jgi:Family of unknown function (DUF5995)
MSLQQVLNDTPVASIDEALAVMNAIDAMLPDDDGVKWFNRLYLRVTLGIGGAVRGDEFHDPTFITKLAVVFATLYFSALASGMVDPNEAPSAWRPLMRARHRVARSPHTDPA